MRPIVVGICAGLRSIPAILWVAAFLLLPAVLWAPGAVAATYVVHADGTGDFPTIQAAIDAASDTDVIELTDGTFRGPGNRDVDCLHKAITVRSQSGDPGVCVLDAEGSAGEPHGGFRLVGIRPPGATLAGITVADCWTDAPDGGSAIRCDSSSALTVVDCVISENHGSAIYGGNQSTLNLDRCQLRMNSSGFRGGAILCLSATLEADGCDFTVNTAPAGGAVCSTYSSLNLTNCTFVGNTAGVSAAVDCTDNSQLHATDCLFSWNEATDHNGIVSLFLVSAGTLERCTFFGNNSRDFVLYSEKISRTRLTSCTFSGNQADVCVVLAGSTEVVFENTIIAWNAPGPAVHSVVGAANLSCCDLYGNQGGDWTGDIAGQLGLRGNIALDPQFCNAGAGDLNLHEGSPCAPEHNPECGLIGAWPVACGATPVRETTWGRLKAGFR